MLNIAFRRAAILFAFAALIFVGSTTPLSAQPSESRDMTYVELTSVKQVHEGDDHFIEIKAKVPHLPVGCKVVFILSWNYQRTQSNVFTVPANKRIEERIKIKHYAPSATPYIMQTELVKLKDQPRKVKRELEKDPKTFPPGAEPWSEHHDDKKFLMGTKEEIAAEIQRINEWFDVRWKAIAGLSLNVYKAAKGVEAGTDYVNGKGEFEEDKWRKMMDKDVLQPLRDYQKEIAEGLTGSRTDLIAYRPALADLRELTRAVALRVTKKSIEVYKSKGLPAAAEDEEPEELNTRPRGFRGKRIPKSKDLEKIVNRMKLKLAPPKSEKPEGATP